MLQTLNAQRAGAVERPAVGGEREIGLVRLRIDARRGRGPVGVEVGVRTQFGERGPAGLRNTDPGGSGQLLRNARCASRANGSPRCVASASGPRTCRSRSRTCVCGPGSTVTRTVGISPSGRRSALTSALK
jgi:hypothetical protein